MRYLAVFKTEGAIWKELEAKSVECQRHSVLLETLPGNGDELRFIGRHWLKNSWDKGLSRPTLKLQEAILKSPARLHLASCLCGSVPFCQEDDLEKCWNGQSWCGDWLNGTNRQWWNLACGKSLIGIKFSIAARGLVFKGQGGRGSFFLSLRRSLNSEQPGAVVAVSLKMSLYSHHCLKKGAQVNDQG